MTQEIEMSISDDQVELIKRTIARGATDDELALLLHQYKRTGLDPLSKQMHFVKRKVRKEDGSYEMVGTIQIGIDGLRAIAERTGCYAPGSAPEIEEKNGTLISATATVIKIVQGTPYPVSAKAYFSEYVPTYNGKVLGLWAKMPRLMLAKCAEALALRKAFPMDLSGIYSHEEMEQAGGESVEHKTEAKAEALQNKLAEATKPIALDTVRQEQEAKEKEDALPLQADPGPEDYEACRGYIIEGLAFHDINAPHFFQTVENKIGKLQESWGMADWERAKVAFNCLVSGKYRLVEGKFKRNA